METRVHIFLSFVKLQKENMMCQPEGWATDHYEADKQTAELSVLDSIKLLVSQASPLIYLVLLNIGKLFFIIGVPRRDSTRKSQTVGVGYTFYEGK